MGNVADSTITQSEHQLSASIDVTYLVVWFRWSVFNISKCG